MVEESVASLLPCRTEFIIISFILFSISTIFLSFQLKVLSATLTSAAVAEVVAAVAQPDPFQCL